MQNVDYDLLIIGGGPAGLTAGLYAARARLRVLLVERLVPGGQMVTTDRIENYPGFPEGISGPELSLLMINQADRFDLEIETNEVMSLGVGRSVHTISLSDRTVTAHAIIIATGASPKKLGIPGEETFWGKGVSCCATCDGPFYKDRVAVAVGGGDTALKESLFLTKFVEKVYLVHRRERWRAETIWQERVRSHNRIVPVCNAVLTRINGGDVLESVSLTDVATGNTREIKASACFIWIGIEPNTGFIGNTLRTDNAGFIFADAEMKTSVPGIFAAGDVRVVPTRQIAGAVGDGAVAAFSAQQYIESIE